MSYDPIADFDKGGFSTTNDNGGSSETALFPFYVQSVEMVKGQYTNKDGSPQYQFKVWVALSDPDSTISKNDLFNIIYQTAYFTDDKKLKNPAYPAYKTATGEEKPASNLYEIIHAAKEYDPKGYEQKKADCMDKDGRVDWKQLLTGLKFNYEAKIGDKKDGTGKFVILQTPKQKQKDADYKKKNTSAPVSSTLINTDDLPF